MKSDDGIREAPLDQFTKAAWMLASIAVVVVVLYLAKGVLVPLALAVLLSFLLSPVCDWLERRRLGRIPAVLVTTVLGFTVLGAAAWTVVVQITELAPKLPEYQDNLGKKMTSTNAYLSAALEKVTRVAEGFDRNLLPLEKVEAPQGTDARPFSVRVLTSPTSSWQFVGGTFGALLPLLGSVGVVIVLVVFFLIRREDLRDRFIRLVGSGEVNLTTQVLEDAARRVSRYLSMQFLINLLFGAVIAAGASLIGLPNALLWGILATTLRFIPYIGPWIAAAMPIGLSLAISSNWLAPILTIGLFVVLELFTNNVMEPWLYGKNTGVSAVAVLVAALFWTWLWGIAGLLLATPLTVCLLVLGKHVPELSFLDTILGNEPVFEPKKRVYQRLLAGDQEEAAELLDELLETKPLVEVLDTVLIPALAAAEVHWHRGEMAEGRHRLILQSLREIIEDLGQRPPERQTQAPSKELRNEVEDAANKTSTIAPPASILCLPARDEADEIAALMLAQLLGATGSVAQAVSVTTKASELIDLVEHRQPNVICISATPPVTVMHARYLCTRLRVRLPNVKLVIGLWDMPGDLAKATRRIAGGPNAHVVTTLADALEQVRILIQPPMPSAQNLIRPECGPKIMDEAIQ